MPTRRLPGEKLYDIELQVLKLNDKSGGADSSVVYGSWYMNTYLVIA